MLSALPLLVAVQQPRKRLRQLDGVAGRGLLLGCPSKAAPPCAHYFSLAARCPGGDEPGAGAGPGGGGERQWRLVYRSEAVRGCFARRCHLLLSPLRAAIWLLAGSTRALPHRLSPC